MFTIGELSKQTDVNIETIRYYERIKLVPAPSRTESGRRLYDDKDVRRLMFVRHARDLGFEIVVIKRLLALQEKPEASCKDVTRIASDQLESVESRIRRLVSLRKELTRMVAACCNNKVATCRIIEVLTESNESRRLKRIPGGRRVSLSGSKKG
ncbi:MAG: helix-turn-helix domain-containing protein [Proteobacteria bacterium]|nr:helix-turn-helix domain-containing protein [Pseudomonadota bacterium]